MKKYRARFDDPTTGAFWLTGDGHIDSHLKSAFVGTMSQSINLVAKVVRHDGIAVSSGNWTLERKSKEWTQVP